MPATEKIDILVMRGTGRVKRYHLAPGWLHALWLTPLFLLVVVLLAGGFILRQYAAESQVRDRLATMEAEHDAVGERLLRLENIENILRSRDTDALDAFLAAASPDAPDWWKPRSGERKETAKDKPGPKIDLSRLFAKVDTNAAGVDNLRAKIENRRLALNFDLSNLSPQSALVGRGEASLVGNDGAVSPLKDEKDELAFQIQRFKQIATSFALPAKYDPKDVYGVKLTMTDPAGKIIFSQIFPLSQK